jgi:hypothetical protein
MELILVTHFIEISMCVSYYFNIGKYKMLMRYFTFLSHPTTINNVF